MPSFHHIKCFVCGKHGKFRGKIYCSNRCAAQVENIKRANKISITMKLKICNMKNENHPQWKGNSVGLNGLHTWLNKNFGKANFCENSNCLKKSHHFEYAKLREKEYERKRENFIKLCRSCHKIYDSKMSTLQI